MPDPRGIFPDDTLQSLPASICLAHIDVDTYRSVKESFAQIWPRVQLGVWSYSMTLPYFGCEGANQAVNEIVAAHDDGLFIQPQRPRPARRATCDGRS
jgi:O-methyltransferase